MSTATTTTLAMHDPTIVNAASLDISVPDVGATVLVGSVVGGAVGCVVAGSAVCVGFAVGCVVGVG